jgi:Putative Ig domain/Right handed beta helix region
MTYSSSSVRHAVFATLVALATAASGVALASGVANAAPPQTRHVAKSGHDAANTCLNPADPCATIQHAVDVADPGDTVSVAGGTFHESVRIGKSLTLHGAGATGAGRTTIDGNSQASGPSIWINGFQSDVAPVVTIEDVDVSGNTNDDGIRAELATVTVTASAVSDNDGNGIGQRDGTLHVDHSTVSGNDIGGVVLEREETGATADIETTTLDHNVGGGLVVDGRGNTATLRASTVSGTVPFNGQEGEPYGGGVLVLQGAAQIANSTIFGNTGQGVLSQIGQVRVNNSTIAGTRPLTAGTSSLPAAGVAVDDRPLPAAATRSKVRFAVLRNADGATQLRRAALAPALPVTTLTGTIVADNTSLPDCTGDVVDAGYNLAGDTSCSFSATGSIQSGTAKLGPLADNGGPTLTLLPAKGSQAIDAIPLGKANCAASAADQRGAHRPKPNGGRCDIGAVEVEQTAVVISPNSLPKGTVGKKYHETIAATGGLGAPYVWAFESGHLPPGLSFGTHGVISGTPTEAGRFTFTVSVDDPTLKTYTIVIVAPPRAPSSASATLIANTGANAKPITAVGVFTVGLGLVLLWAAALAGRYARRYRRAH